MLTKRICPRVIKSGICRRQKCNFAHSISELQLASQGANGAGEGDDDDAETDFEKRFARWKACIPTKIDSVKPLKGRLSYFFQEARKLVDVDENLRQRTVYLLSEQGGLPRIEELVELDFSVISDSMTHMFFFGGTLPFLEIVSHPKVHSSLVLEQPLDAIYGCVFGIDGQRGVRFFGSVAEVFEMLLNNADEGRAGQLEAAVCAFTKMVDVNWSSFIHEPFFAFIHEQLRLLAVRLEGIFSRLASQHFSDPLRRTHSHLERLRQRLDVRSLLQVSNAAGSLTYRPPGGRHDNDYGDICDIHILPTAQEIMSPYPEYLPTTDPHQWHVDGVDGLLDRNFRLLREDTMGQLRDTINMLLGAPGDSSHLRRNQLRTYVYRDAQITFLDFDQLAGFQFRVEFPQPVDVYQAGSQQRQEWWTFSQRLRNGSLVCLVDPRGSLVFCTVASEQPSWTPKDEFIANDSLWADPNKAGVVLGPVEGDTAGMQYVLGQYMSQGVAPPFYLVEFPGFILPAFRSTLLTLQKMKRSADLPFPEFLTPPSPDQRAGEVHMRPPEYALKPKFSFNLQCLLKTQADLKLMPGQPFDIKRLQADSSLDDAQAVSLANAIQSRIGLIQGPPGTGKSFTGISLIKVLIDNKKRGMANIGPVVCVCYTNHALDQLLEGLLQQGVSQVIRIGSRSKSPVLGPLNLRVVSRNRHDKTDFEKDGQRHLFRNLEGLKGDFFKLKVGNYIYPNTIAMYLEKHLTHHYAQLFGAVKGDTLTSGVASQIFRNWLGSSQMAWRPPRSLHELNYSDLFQMTKEEREISYASWVEATKIDIQSKVIDVIFAHGDTKAELDKIRGEADLRSLRDADVIGVTTGGLANNFDMLRKLESKVVLCEEAGEVLEGHMLTALLPSVEHAILIGDHLQLPPRIQNYDLSRESEEGKKYSLDVSLFERLVRPENGMGRPVPFSILEVQRRMHPSISQLIRETLYPQLKDDQVVYGYPPVAGMIKRLFWLDHRGHESHASGSDTMSTSDNGSISTYWNQYEIDATIALVDHLMRQGVYRGTDIAVLTPYLGQLNKLRDTFGDAFNIILGDRDQHDLQSAGFNSLYMPGAKPEALRLATIDNFQGEEAKVVVISLVRSNAENRCGFLRTENRINVLLSRARHGMYIIGNSETSRNVPMWDAVIRILQRNGNFGTSHLDFQMLM